MVSKVAVIALIAIVACPILLGYGMNLSDVTETDYKNSGDILNVTQLLQNGTEYSYAAADIIDLNSRVNEASTQSMPEFVSITDNKSPIPVGYSYFSSGQVPAGTQTLSNFSYDCMRFNYNPSVGQLNITLTFNDNTTVTKYRLHSFYWNEVDAVFHLSTFSSTSPYTTDAYDYNDVKSFSISKTSGYNGSGINYYYIKAPGLEHLNKYADLSAGYYLNTYNSVLNNPSTSIRLPNYSNNVLITMDLSTITNSSYSFDLVSYYSGKLFRFEKTTDGSGVHWTVKWGVRGSGTAPNTITELYYDSSQSSNTYQILIDWDSIDFRYVGSWPILYGYANYYWNHEYSFTSSSNNMNISFEGSNKTPLMRIDAADYRAFEYQIIENKTYDPSQFKSNPSTTINDPVIYGTSLTFGGNTYTVTDGNITMGTHQIPVKGLTLSSVPVVGGYENRIGNTVISTTASPSTIAFNGKWSANITTSSMESYTYTHTEWTPGHFGWNGIDQNFLMVGLLTSIGVFIALGIYIRRTKANLWPLLLVCGGAVVLFFTML